MFQLTQSSFLQALGYAIINSLWQFALLWLIYVLLSGIFKFSPHQKYTTGLVLQLGGFTWFIVTGVYYYNQLVALLESGNVVYSDYSQIDAGSSGRENVYTWLIRTEQFLPYLSVAYLLLVIFLGMKWLHCYRFTQRVRTTSRSKINVEWRLFVKQLSMQMGIKGDVTIYLSSLVKSPLTIGFFKPIILIPLASLNSLTTEQMEAVLLHELAHIKRFDYIANLLLSIVEALLFFNPFMQLLSKSIKRERENSCDDWVLQYNYNATTYAKALLQIALQQGSSPAAFAMHSSSDKQVLLGRVKRMIEKKERRHNYRHQLFALLILTGILSSVSFLSPHNRRTETIAAKAKIIIEPLAAKIENPLFNPVFFLTSQEEKEQIADELQEESVETESAIVHVHKPVLLLHEDELEIAEELVPYVEIKEAFNDPVKTQVLRNIEIQLDTLRYHTAFQSVLGTKFWGDIEKAEKELRRFVITDTKTKSQVNELLVKEMQSTLENLRTTRVELSANRALVASKVQRAAKELNTQALRLLSKGKVLKSEEIKTLSEELARELTGLQGQYAVYSAVNVPMENDLFGSYITYAEAPEIAENHAYSYDYDGKGAAARITVTGKGMNAVEVKRTRAPLAVSKESDVAAPAPPQSTERPISRRAVKRIKI